TAPHRKPRACAGSAQAPPHARGSATGPPPGRTSSQRTPRREGARRDAGLSAPAAAAAAAQQATAASRPEAKSSLPQRLPHERSGEQQDGSGQATTPHGLNDERSFRSPRATPRGPKSTHAAAPIAV